MAGLREGAGNTPLSRKVDELHQMSRHAQLIATVKKFYYIILEKSILQLSYT